MSRRVSSSLIASGSAWYLAFRSSSDSNGLCLRSGRERDDRSEKRVN